MNPQPDRISPVDPENKEELYLQTLREAEEYLEKDTPLYRGEKTEQRAGKKGKFLKKNKLPLRQRILKYAAITVITLLGMFIISVLTFLLLFRIGQNKMLSYEEFTPQFPQPSETTEALPTEMQDTSATEPTTEPDRILVYDDGKTVSYKGETYVLNENITTVLLIGVDKDELEDNAVHGEGGEADCVILVSMDTKTGETKLVNISRESYAQVDIYSATGNLI